MHKPKRQSTSVIPIHDVMRQISSCLTLGEDDLFLLILLFIGCSVVMANILPKSVNINGIKIPSDRRRQWIMMAIIQARRGELSNYTSEDIYNCFKNRRYEECSVVLYKTQIQFLK